ncbi:DUF3365 domain-containing protein [Hydrogenimonas thermophila]|uniref:Tll0287-like domain-containing protein n=1 Tax=Hydrogenimonas thermophila TaxID=223786 RepID=UPI002936DD41|nr:DUF3365 domain-containing protein [Hydrogenimonas thermophila]WOE68782.1 DUF3365 domain-containing protein [Hydrogenimonas thermophila]WOE71292.1 DUF3365 domain-containing protein [Hydrogenimonas thermophila]
MNIGRLTFIGLMTSVMLFASQSGQNAMGPKPKKGDGEISQVVKTGQNATKLLLKTLGGNMKKHMKSGGPADALNFCALNASKLTAKVDEKLGKNVSVKRITLKPRNPANEAEKDERRVLEALQTLHETGVRLPRHLIQKTDDGYKFYKPLKIAKKVCLKCHGTNIDPKLEKTIAKFYPTDKATGYKMGDLRGAIVVTIKK